MVSPFLPEVPTEERALRPFERVLGDDEARRVWAEACTAAGLGDGSRPLEPLDLRRVADYLAGQPGLVGVLAASLQIRLHTYIILSGLDVKLGQPQHDDDGR